MFYYLIFLCALLYVGAVISLLVTIFEIDKYRKDIKELKQQVKELQIKTK